jgi:hypothetical protein
MMSLGKAIEATREWVESWTAIEIAGRNLERTFAEDEEAGFSWSVFFFVKL